MGANIRTVQSISNIIVFLAVIPALWISGRIILRNQIREERAASLFLWLALGGFFLIPLIDLLSYLRDFVSLIVSPEENMLDFPLFLGTTSWFMYSITSLFVAIAVYSIAIRYGRKIFAENRLPLMELGSISALERTFILLGVAGLFHAMIRGIVGNFLWILNTGSTRTLTLGGWGVILGAVLGFFILIAAILWMNLKLQTEEP